MRLTAATIRRLVLPPGKAELKVFDDSLPGFGLRLRAGGAQTWIVQYARAGATRRMTLGTPATLDPGKAREVAKDLLAAVRLGRDPAHEKHTARTRAAETLGALLPRYMTRQRANLRRRSYGENERHLLMYAKPLHALAIHAVDRRAVAVLLGKIADKNGPTTANRVRASLSAFFAWAMREGLLDLNPVILTNKAVEKGPRHRVLSDPEIARVWRAAGEGQYAAIIRLLTLTGGRREEIAGLRWDEIDFESALISLPPARTKSGHPHEIPLTAPALEILRAQPQRTQSDGGPRDLVFGRGQGSFQLWSKSKQALDSRIAADGGEPLPAWTLHDFRRTVSTVMHERLGVQPHIVEAVLGHVSGHRAGIAGTYNKALYRGEKRRGLELWAAHVLAAVEGRASNIVPLVR